MVEITLKQYKEFSTKTFTVTTPSPTAPIAITEIRAESTTPASTTTSGGGKSGGGGTKKYKVQIPGMSAVEVNASSVQDAITKACGKNWSGTIYVDGTAYTVKKGVIQTPSTTKVAGVAAVVTAVTKTANKAVSTVAAKKDTLTKTYQTSTKTNTSTSTGNGFFSTIKKILSKK